MTKQRSWATGEQHEITHKDQQAWVTEVGATLRAYTDGEGALLDGFEPDVPISAARGQVLMPWPNRIRDGHYDIEANQYQLTLTEPERSNALHGLMRWANWRLVDEEQTDSSVVLEHRSHPQPGYPFAIHARVSYTLSDDGLEVCMTATNVGNHPCPFGMGAHPYLTAGTASIDNTALVFPATTYLPPDDQMIPAAELAVTDMYDYRFARPLHGIMLDTAFGGLERDEQSRANVDLLRVDGSGGVRVWMDEMFQYVMIFTGDTLPDSRERRRGLGVEPMTCAPDAFNNKMGLHRLDPRQSLSGSWGIARLGITNAN